MLRALMLLALTGLAGAAEPVLWPVVLNDTGAGLATDPAFARHPGGASTFLWHSYQPAGEQVLSVAIDSAGISRVKPVTPGAGTYYRPVVVATGPHSGWAFWMEQVAGEWRISGRHFNNGVWEPATALSGNKGLFPAAVTVGKHVVLAWEDHSSRPQSIVCRTWNGDEWLPPVALSRKDAPSFRPALAANDQGHVWVFWDTYDGHYYQVFGRQIEPRMSDPAHLSPVGADCLKSAAAAFGSGQFAVAWVSTRDVIGGAGVLDHWDTLQMAVLSDGKWAIAKDGASPYAAELRHGLLPHIEPHPSNMSGYQGRRRQPMLVSDGTGVWLLWERKEQHDGKSYFPGDLCGRRFDSRWSDPVKFADGLADYRVGAAAEPKVGKLLIVGLDPQRRYQVREIRLDGAKFDWNNWPGWKPVTLPLHPQAPRESIEAGGARYHLYWADFHVHSALSSDAEGEPDELFHFARDKAQIDIVVVQENDINSWMNTAPQGAYSNRPLTNSEYALSVFLSREQRENGRFLALPGWEWSQRILADPAGRHFNWEQNNSQSNHRTVIFFGDYAPLLRHSDNNGDFRELCDVVQAAGGLMHTQHEAYRLVGCPVDTAVEVASGWGVFFKQPQKIHSDLNAGYRFGFIATSDGHRRNPGTGGGLAGVWATELTPQAIREALVARRVFATTGTHVAIDARANGALMGREIKSNGTVKLTLRARSPRMITRAVLVRDAEEIYDARSGSTVIDVSYSDHPAMGSHWYYWRIELEGETPEYPGNMKVAEGNLAWSTPNWVDVKNP